MDNIKRLTVIAVCTVFTLPLSGQNTMDADEDLGPIQNLEAFIVRESSADISGGIDPASHRMENVFNVEMSVMDIPRSVTQITPEHMKYLQIEDLRSLSKFGAGTQLINHYGVTGTPIIRGAKGATLLNGMVRSFNLNEMPLSFGSSEALNLVKGPTPPHISPTHVGGYVNLVPKSPFFDKRRGSLELTIGSYDKYRLLLDHGGPFLLGSKPSAYRVSLTLQREAGYYDRLRDDFESLYAAVKTDLTSGLQAFGGFEFFHYQSNENAGWNRPTQDLINSGRYIVGEPVNIVDAGYQYTANRDLASFPFGFGWANGIEDFNALVIPGEVVNEAVSSGLISEAARQALLDLSDPDDIARAYGQPLPSTGRPDPAFQADPAVADTLARLSDNPNEGYRYTRAYFDQGGVVFTTPLEGSQILGDEEDRSEAYNWVGFFDLSWTGKGGTHWKNKTLIDTLRTEKLSSYGYAIDTEQFIVADRLEALHYLDWANATTWSYGMGLRYTHAKMVQDYFAEPFSRRDLSRPVISNNSRVLAGPLEGPDGLNYWSPDIGANVQSNLFQSGWFSQLDSQLTDRFRILISGRIEQAWFDASLPDEVDRAGESIRREIENSGSETLYSLGAYLTYRLVEGLNLYVAGQDGISLDLTQGGGVYGEQNFANARLAETGVKWSLWDERIQGSVSMWNWEQSRFNQRDFQSEPLEGEGIEFETTLALIRERLYLIASAENQQIRRNSPLGFRALPLSDQEWALNAGVLNGGVIEYPENNPDLNYPGIPDTTYKGHLVWKGEHYQLALSGVYSRSHWLNFEQTLRLPSSLLLSLYAGYRWQSWEVALTVENLSDEDYFIGADPLFASNTLVTKGKPRRYALRLKWQF